MRLPAARARKGPLTQLGEMAAVLGGHQPWYSRTAITSSQLNRSLERVLEEAVHSGILNLSGRKLKEFPAVNYDLTDTVQAGGFVRITPPSSPLPGPSLAL